MLARFSELTITKGESILDAAGGPQDLLAGFSLLFINPSLRQNQSLASQMRGIFFAGDRRVLEQRTRIANFTVYKGTVDAAKNRDVRRDRSGTDLTERSKKPRRYTEI